MQRVDLMEEIMQSLEKHKKWIASYKYPEDLYQESIYSLLNQGQEKIIKLHKDMELDRYFSKVVIMNHKQCRSKHNANFKDDRALYYTGLDQDQYYGQVTETIDLDKDLDMITNYWYEKEILKMYVDCGTITKLSQETKIPYKTLQRTISKLKKRMK